MADTITFRHGGRDERIRARAAADGVDTTAVLHAAIDLYLDTEGPVALLMREIEARDETIAEIRALTERTHRLRRRAKVV